MSHIVSWSLYVLAAALGGVLLGRGLNRLVLPQVTAALVKRAILVLAALILVAAFLGLFGRYALVANAMVLLLLVTGVSGGLPVTRWARS